MPAAEYAENGFEASQPNGEKKSTTVPRFFFDLADSFLFLGRDSVLFQFRIRYFVFLR